MKTKRYSKETSSWNLLPALLVIGLFFSAFAIFLYTSLLPDGTKDILGDHELSLQNYIKYFHSEYDLLILIETLWLSAKLTIAAFLLGYPVTYIIVRSESSLLRNFLLASLVMTFLSGSVTRAYAWLVILGNAGLINTLLLKLGLLNKAVSLVYNELGVFIAILHFVLPFFVLTMMGPLKNVSRTFEESAINLGASRFTTFLRITLPLSLHGIVAASSLVFALSLSSFLFPMILGGGRVRFVANAIYEYIFVNFNFPFAAATATIFLVIALFFVWAFSTVQKLVNQTYTLRKV